MKHRDEDAPPSEAETRTAMIRELLEADEAEDRIVERVRAILTPVEIEVFVSREIRSEINRMRRTAITAIMRGVTPGRTTRPTRVHGERDEFIENALGYVAQKNEDPGERLSRRADLLVQGFKIRGHGFVTWGDATVAHHRMRLEQLKALMGGAYESATMHVRAISEIEAVSVASLNEVAALRHANEKAIEAPVPA